MLGAARWQLACAAALITALAILSWRTVAGHGPAQDTGMSSAVESAARLARLDVVRRASVALAAAERTHGAESPETARALDALVISLLPAAENLTRDEVCQPAERAINLWSRLSGETSLQTAHAMSAYASALGRFEEYRSARPLADRALAIRLRTPGADPTQVASSLYQVAELMRMEGDYAGACSLHARAIAAWRGLALLDEPSEQGIADSLHYLGVMKASMGDNARATELIEESLAIRERLKGVSRDKHDNHDKLAASLNLLGVLVLQNGDRSRAMSLFGRAQRLWEETFGPRHGHVARSLVNQANLLMQVGDLAGARGLYERALSLREQAFGPDHYLTARSLADLARISARAGDVHQAQDFFTRALAIQRRDPEARGPELAGTLIDDARLILATGDSARALELALEAESLARVHFLRTSRGLSEPEALRYETVRSSGLDVALTTIEGIAGGDGIGRVWDEAIRSRAMVLDEMAARHREGQSSPRAESGLAEVAAAVPQRSVLVAYLKYRRQPRKGGEAPVAAYMGFALASGAKTPSMIPLGEASGIDRMIRAWREGVGSDPRAAPGQQAEARSRRAGRRLREAIWDPMARLFAGAKMVFVVPDGAIGLVSLAALPTGEDRYLVEEEQLIHYLSAERDLMVSARPAQETHRVLALGGPAFDAPPSSGPPRPSGFRSALPACPAFTSMRFVPLAASMREADDVETFWRPRAAVLKLTGADATEAALKQAAPGHDMLHIATHGYYLKGGCSYGMPSPAADNPLLMTGLALAGANHRADAGRDADDGIMTAEEIGALDLSGAHWAVLSGCETGVGPVMDGEGVLGLRRAFQVAGAGTLIMSLWPVDDGATRLWMKQLYEGRLAGLSTVETVSRAGLQMLRRQRAAGHGGHPYYWGGFVAAGDWR